MALFTLSEAQALLPRIQGLTQEAAARVQALVGEAAALAANDPRRVELAEQARVMVNQWAEAITALGAEAKGLWLVDFDHGEGYYCWKFPEESVEYEHSYEGGFRGRELIEPEVLH